MTQVSSMDEQSTRFEDLRLLPGQVLQLDFDGYTSDRDKSVLIGYRSGQGIIVSTPIVNGSPMVLKLGAALTVRFFAPQMNCACAFRTEVVHISRAPYSHLHLAMPDNLVLGSVRNSVRAKVSLVCSVHYGDEFAQSASVLVRDLSLGGARLQSKMLPVLAGDPVEINLQLTVLDVKRTMTLAGIVRSVGQDAGGVAVGVQFTDISDENRIALYAYVLSNVHK